MSLNVSGAPYLFLYIHNPGELFFSDTSMFGSDFLMFKDAKSPIYKIERTLYTQLYTEEWPCLDDSEAQLTECIVQFSEKVGMSFAVYSLQFIKTLNVRFWIAICRG